MKIDLKHFDKDKPREFYRMYAEFAEVGIDTFQRRLKRGMPPIDALTVKNTVLANKGFEEFHYWLSVAISNGIRREQFSRNRKHGMTYEEAATSLFVTEGLVADPRDIVLAQLLNNGCPIKPRDRQYVIENEKRLLKVMEIV